MSRRRSSNAGDSLELQLDTVCNVFGSIMLITLLVAMLLTRSSQTSSRNGTIAKSQAELIEADTIREQKERRLAELRKRSPGAADAAKVIASDELIEHAKRYNEADLRRSELLRLKSQLVGAASEAQLESNEIDRKLEEQRAELEELKGRIAAANVNAAETATSKSRVVAVPRMSHTTLGDMNSYFLRDGRLHGPLYLPNGQRNLEEFTFGDLENPNAIIPNPAGGIAVDEEADSILSRFALIDARETYVRFYCWSTAYHCFEPVRLALESRGIKYQLIPCEPGTSVQFSSYDPEPPVVQ